MLDAPSKTSTPAAAKFTVGETSIDLPVKDGHIGPSVVDISKL